MCREHLAPEFRSRPTFIRVFSACAVSDIASGEMLPKMDALTTR